MTTPTTRLLRIGPLTWLYGATILIGAFLVFQVQPIISKTILPWFGGSPAVWTTCMLFFQVLLFAGYTYAHMLTRLRIRWQVVVHVGLISTALLLIPIIPDPAWKSQSSTHPTLTILLLLTSTVGLPYFLLSSTAPLVQSWFSRSHPGKTPYRLYALSNTGSLTALLTYPFLVEPTMTTWTQGTVWSMSFVVFALCCGGCAAAMRHTVTGSKDGGLEDEPGTSQDPALPAASGQTAPTWRACRDWLLLTAVPSMMLLATTNHVCQDVAVVPFLWVAPLSLYLVSFIICFDKEAWYSRRWCGLGTLLCVTVISVCSIADYSPPLIAEVGVYFATLFFICMVCHGELVRRKPAPRYLTHFYLFSSAGGALGGTFVALICPRLFSGFYEMNAGLIIAYVIAAPVCFTGLLDGGWLPGRRRGWAAMLALAGFLFVLRAQAERIGDTGLVASRNFYGVLHVKESDSSDPAEQGRFMIHGRITHGFQFRDPARRMVPTLYFTEDSGVGITLRNYPRQGPMRVGVIGLGAGTLAVYGRPGDTYRFYEINPEVERLAREYFTFLNDSRADVQVVIGDARLSMEREPPQQFDVLVLDAFSGDAIPAHLLTKEAFDVYRRHLRPQGVIAVHISNRYLDLYPVVRRAAEYSHMPLLCFLVDRDISRHRFASQWCVMSNNHQFMDNPQVRSAARGQLGTYAMIPLWTDQYNNLFRVLK